MKKVNWQYLIDALLFISVTGVVIVGFLLAFVIASGPVAADSAKYFLGLHRHEWGNIHLYLGITFTILTVVHLLLGWKWVKGKTQGLFGNRWKATLFAMCSLAFGVLVVSWLIYPGELGTYDRNQMRAVRTDRGILKAGETPSYDPSNAIQKGWEDCESDMVFRCRNSGTVFPLWSKRTMHCEIRIEPCRSAKRKHKLNRFKNPAPADR